MRHAQREPDFAEEPLQPVRVAFDVARQKFQRDGLSEFQVLGAIDLTHAAATEQRDHAVAVADHLSRDEVPAIERRLRRRGTDDGFRVGGGDRRAARAAELLGRRVGRAAGRAAHVGEGGLWQMSRPPSPRTILA